MGVVPQPVKGMRGERVSRCWARAPLRYDADILPSDCGPLPLHLIKTDPKKLESRSGVADRSELSSRSASLDVPDDDARDTVDLLSIEIVDFDAELAVQAASLRLTTKRFGLSLGDRCCLALGIAREATVLTSERTWSKLKMGLRVKVIR